MAAVEITWKTLFWTLTGFLSIIYGTCIGVALAHDCETFKNNHLGPRGWLLIKGAIGFGNIAAWVLSYYLNASNTEYGNRFRDNRGYVIAILYVVASFLVFWNFVGGIEIIGSYNYGPNYKFCHRNVIITTWTVIITLTAFYYLSATFFLWKSISIGYDMWDTKKNPNSTKTSVSTTKGSKTKDSSDSTYSEYS